MKEAIKIKVMILASMLAVMLLGCSENKDNEEKAAEEQRKHEIVIAQHSRDSVETVMIASLDEIDKRLGLIKSQKGYLVFNSSKGDVKNKKEQILNNIALMDELISENEKRIEDLRKELKRVNSKNKGIQKRIAKYEEMNKEMEMEIDGLRSQLNEQKEKNDKLTADVERLNIEMANQGVVYDNLKTQYTKAESDAYTAYLAKGTRKELKKENVIEKKTLRNLVANDRINSNAPAANFEKIDTRTTLEIPVSAKDAKIVTSHDETSYKWIEDESGMKKLAIVDPQAFWQKSKYLVIETK